MKTSQRPVQTHSWEFTFTDLETGRPVTSGVFAPEFCAARDKALTKLTSKVGGDKGRYVYAGYKRLI